jgi:hypothetical protein
MHPILNGREAAANIEDIISPHASGASMLAANTAGKRRSPAVEHGGNPLLAFGSEKSGAALPAGDPNRRRHRPRSRRLFTAVLIVAAIAAALGWYMQRGRYATAAAEPAPLRPGRLTITTRPSGADVLIDGRSHGPSPVVAAVQSGEHIVAIRSDRGERSVRLLVTAGAEIGQDFDISEVPTVSVGQLSVSSEPPGARVLVDGHSRGVSPLVIAGVAAGDHKVTVISQAGSAERSVTVPRGGTAAAMFTLPKAAGPVGGWLAIASPFDLDVLERDEVIGTSGANRIMLAEGHHEIKLANRTLSYTDTRRVEVIAGKTTAIRVDAPKASLSVNARPWADVTIDGNATGQTPIANLLVAIGRHEIVFRHPQFGERRQSVLVRAQGPNRVAVDLTK